MDTSQIGIEHVQTKGQPYWKLYEGTRKVAQCEAEENPEASPEIAFDLFVSELQGREGKHDVLVYKNLKGESGGSRKTFVLPPITAQRSMYGHPNMNAQAIYDRAKQDVEMMLTQKRIEEKLDLILLFIKERNDDDDGNDDRIVKLIGSALGASMGKAPAAAARLGAPAANAGLFGGL